MTTALQMITDLNQFRQIGKPFLETAPYLIVVFKKNYDLKVKRKKNYYVNESVGIASEFC